MLLTDGGKQIDLELFDVLKSTYSNVLDKHMYLQYSIVLTALPKLRPLTYSQGDMVYIYKCTHCK